MKFTAFQDKLNKGLGYALKVISRNVSLPILENFLLKTESGRLKITATNLEEAIEVRVAGKIEKEGEVTVPANVFSNLISNLNDQKITLELKENILHITSDDFSAEIKGQETDDFPVIPEVEAGSEFTFKTEEIKQGLNQVLNIVTSSGTRPELSGVYFRFTGNKELKVVATDSFRLGEKTISAPDDDSDAHSFILPFRAASELNRLLDAAGEDFALRFDKNQALFDLDGVRLTSRLIEGNYPDYEQIIPDEFTTEVTVPKEELIKKIRLVSTLASDSNAVSIDLDADKGSVLMHTSSSAKGASKSSLQEASIKGDSVKISFNWRYLMDGLSNLEGEKVVFRLNGSDKPSLLRTEEDTSYFYIAMPIRE